MDHFFRSLGYRIEPGESHACWRAPAHVAGGKEALAGRYSEAQRPGALYISRVENGHTVLSIETLEKLACVRSQRERCRAHQAAALLNIALRELLFLRQRAQALVNKHAIRLALFYIRVTERNDP